MADDAEESELQSWEARFDRISPVQHARETLQQLREIGPVYTQSLQQEGNPNDPLKELPTDVDGLDAGLITGVSGQKTWQDFADSRNAPEAPRAERNEVSPEDRGTSKAR